MKLFALLLVSLYSFKSFASWYHNQDGGFGFYQPEAWQIEQDYRLSRMRGPAGDVKQSDFIMGSDWIENLHVIADLKAEVQSKYPNLKLEETEVSGIKGFRVIVKKYTEIYLLRADQNVILIRYLIQGSSSQIDEGHEVISSIEIQTEN
ncbi:MAG: hypothetical protein ACXVAX_01900 [Pseudobdellovibrio sp.]